MPGRLTGWKGQREVLRAYGQLYRAGAALPVLVFAGDAQGRDAYVAELEAIIADYALGDRVKLVGHCSDMPAALMLSRLVLTPSIEPEAFGRTAAEAGAMGKLVIAADHGGAREVIIQGDTGWRVAPGDVDELAATIEQALNLDETSYSGMSDRARMHVRQSFSTEQLQASTLRVYEEVLNSAK